MKAKKLWFVIGVLVLLGGSGALQAAAPPSLLNYQGVLRSASGAPENGAFNMDFAFYDTDGGAPGAPACPAVGGTLLLTDSQSGVPVTGGLFNVQLGGGAVTPGTEGSLAEVFRDNGAVYLEVEVAGEILCPRVQVISAAYSLNADHLDGKDSSEILDTSAVAQVKTGGLGIGTFSPSTHQLTVESTDAETMRLIGPGVFGSGSRLNFGDAEFVYIDEPQDDRLEIHASQQTAITGGPVGIGTTSPRAKLHVAGSTMLDGDVTVSGTIESTLGGIRFPDGSVQTSAVISLPPDTCFDNVGRFVDCGDGAVKDNLTGLFWLENANCFGLLNWASASIAAAQLGDGQCGLTDGSSPGDWRLPTQAEWQVIVDQANSNACSAPFFPDTLGTGCCGPDPCAFAGVQSLFFWSSSTFASNPSSAWRANLFNGSVSNSFSKANSFFVWPVRAGP